MTSVGTRVFAVRDCTKEELNIFGFGIYDGDFEHPYAKRYDAPGLTNPRITLDNGSIVWGCQCWWGAEERWEEYKQRYKDRKIVVVPVEEMSSELEGS